MIHRKRSIGGGGSWRGIDNPSGHIHRRQWRGRSKHDVGVPSHCRRQHHKCNKNDSEPTHSSEIKQKSCQFYEALHKLGGGSLREGPMTTVWIYVDTNHDVGHPDHLKVFATPDAADEWFKDPRALLLATRLKGRPRRGRRQRRPLPDHPLKVLSPVSRTRYSGGLPIIFESIGRQAGECPAPLLPEHSLLRRDCPQRNSGCDGRCDVRAFPPQEGLSGSHIAHGDGRHSVKFSGYWPPAHRSLAAIQ